MVMLKGDIRFDEAYDSGIEGSPGARFVVQLNSPPLELKGLAWGPESSVAAPETSMDEDFDEELPENLSILFVDDQLMLRKLFTRSIKKVAPTWKVQEASNGETALRLVDQESYDIILMDQYMASTDKQLLGTETVRALRAKGVKNILCGLSANDMEKSFLGAGADSFFLKPFPCIGSKLKSALLRVLSSGEQDRAATNGTLKRDVDLQSLELPNRLSVLFVDDDKMLRKLFSRAVKQVEPTWEIQEAATGEAALELVNGETFDLIFMDQYMTGKEKGLLGTETIRSLRSKGVNSIICGLSANDLECPFINAGAECFKLKPIPCKGDELKSMLKGILFKRHCDKS
jgi:CheY-like chemotaxis protein